MKILFVKHLLLFFVFLFNFTYAQQSTASDTTQQWAEVHISGYKNGKKTDVVLSAIKRLNLEDAQDRSQLLTFLQQTEGFVDISVLKDPTHGNNQAWLQNTQTRLLRLLNEANLSGRIDLLTWQNHIKKPETLNPKRNEWILGITLAITGATINYHIWLFSGYDQQVALKAAAFTFFVRGFYSVGRHALDTFRRAGNDWIHAHVRHPKLRGLITVVKTFQFGALLGTVINLAGSAIGLYPWADFTNRPLYTIGRSYFESNIHGAMNSTGLAITMAEGNRVVNRRQATYLKAGKGLIIDFFSALRLLDVSWARHVSYVIASFGGLALFADWLVGWKRILYLMRGGIVTIDEAGREVWLKNGHIKYGITATLDNGMNGPIQLTEHYGYRLVPDKHGNFELHFDNQAFVLNLNSIQITRESGDGIHDPSEKLRVFSLLKNGDYQIFEDTIQLKSAHQTYTIQINLDTFQKLVQHHDSRSVVPLDSDEQLLIRGLFSSNDLRVLNIYPLQPDALGLDTRVMLISKGLVVLPGLKVFQDFDGNPVLITKDIANFVKLAIQQNIDRNLMVLLPDQCFWLRFKSIFKRKHKLVSSALSCNTREKIGDSH